MLSLNQLNKRIFDLEHQLIPQSLDITYIHSGRIDTLYWIKNNNLMKTEEEIKLKIQRYKEELLALNDTTDMHYREKVARIKELEFVLTS